MCFNNFILVHFFFLLCLGFKSTAEDVLTILDVQGETDRSPGVSMTFLRLEPTAPYKRL